MSVVSEPNEVEVGTIAEVKHRSSSRYSGMVASDVMTLVEAGIYLKCHPKTVTRMAVNKRIPSRRVGSLWRFSRKKLEAWMQDEG